ncbi:MAG: LysR family transcriptional regulator [Burkholderiales bacterium]|nr:LysR family transcriptional regulator [Burkholderiales bacterium]
MDSRFLESLIYVTETGSIAQAARMQHLTAAAISQRIRTLEMEFGTDLLIRTGHCAKPTDACTRILMRARHIVSEVDELVDDLRPDKYSCPLRIGLIPSQWSPNLPLKLEALREIFPMVRMSLSLNTSRILYAELLKGELDAAIIEAPEFVLPRQIQSYLLRHEELVLIAKSASLQDVRTILQTNPYIEYRPAPFIANIAAQYLEDRGIFLNPICDTGSLESIKVLVQEGAGVSLVPRWPGLECEEADLFVHKLEGGQYARKIVLLSTETAGQKDFFHQLLDTLRQH